MKSVTLARTVQVDAQNEAAAPPTEMPVPPMPPPADRHRLLDECRELVSARLAQVVHAALDEMDERLASDALQATGLDRRQALLEALSFVREHRVDIALGFRQTFRDAFERRLFRLRAGQVAQAATGPLTLVPQAEIDGRLAVDRLAHRARARLDPDEVLGIRARLGALLERDWFEETAHPAAPEAVFEALKDVLDTLAPRPDVERALLEAFEPFVAAELNHIYVTVNERLRANRVLPVVRPRVGPAEPGRQAARAPAGPHGPTTGDPSAERDAVPTGPVGVSGGWGAAAGTGGPASWMPLEELVERLGHGHPQARLQARRLLADPAAFEPAGPAWPPVGAPLLDALSRLQASAGTDEELAHRLVERAREDGGPLDALTVEIVSIIFDYIHADTRLPVPVKHQLMRLQVVAVKAALIDRSFFARRRHPLRRLLDRVTELAADPDADTGPDSALIAGLAAVVDWVLQDFRDDLGCFETALARIDALADEETARQTTRVAARAAEADRLDRLARAREAAGALLTARLATAPGTPHFVQAFLRDWWTVALAQSRLDAGETGSAWEEGLRVADELLWSLAPRTPSEIAGLARRLPALIGALMRGARAASMPEAERQPFFDALLRAHTRVVESAKQASARDAAASARASATIPVSTTPVSTTAVPVPAERVPPGDAVLGALRRGDRIDLRRDDGDPRRYKLAWVSPGRRLFVLSRHPEESLSMEAEELAAWMADGRAHRVTPEASLLEQALDAASMLH